MKTQNLDYRGYCFPPEIISYTVWLYHRFCLSFRDVEELLGERGVTSATRRSASGVGSLVKSLPRNCGIAKGGWATRGTLTKCLSRLTESATICGVRSIRMVMCWISWSKSVGTSALPSASFVSC